MQRNKTQSIHTKKTVLLISIFKRLNYNLNQIKFFYSYIEQLTGAITQICLTGSLYCKPNPTFIFNQVQKYEHIHYLLSSTPHTFQVGLENNHANLNFVMIMNHLGPNGDNYGGVDGDVASS